MKKKILQKFSQYFIAFIFISTLNFFIPRLMPGDPFTFLSSESNSDLVTFSDEQIQKYKAYYGLDKPISVQYINYLKNIFKGYLGYSIILNQEVLSIIMDRILWTISLVLISTITSAILGMFLGCISAYYRNKIIDKIFYFLFVIFSEIPSFLIGVLFLFYFSAYLKIFPLSGGISAFVNYNSIYEYIFDLGYHAILPIITLSFTNIGGFYLLSRNSMISVLEKDYMITARAKGLNKKRIIFSHALKNAILPVITKVFLNFGYVIGGSILIENVFNYPGIGMLMKNAVFYRDYPLIQGIFLLLAIMVLTMNLFADLIYKKLDPRLK
ncbi:ABC transporter permease [Tepidibacter thalassicus]|uniref:Peptide/nickel transport system permease protein n=1 Tax=Tepidibacter thalassicus DSM 15285 TaxID=1123350 RepID=A0A1M5P1V4_9FIRM|nr:ABC transporter permease [Tepidibacter thalassicus]SHG95780.1 peptide/nickel transport system permease protein [Tepidibacter thalassicus DSM 15285]